MRPASALARALAVVLVLVLAPPAAAQHVELAASASEIYAGLPFVLSAQASGFAEAPEPEVSPLAIPGCEVTYLGQTPNVSTMISIVNGRKTESREVKFVYRWRVVASAPGTYRIPEVRVTQGATEAAAPPAQFSAREVASTDEMRLGLELPERPLWVGETFPIAIEWDIRRDVSDQIFVIPLFEREDAFDVEAPPPEDERDRRRRLAFEAGPKTLELPFERSSRTVDGKEYVRFRFEARATAVRAGRFDLAPARVLARVQTGMGRDRFGFPAPRLELRQAEDRPRTVEVRPLPLEGRPASFSGAVGTGFSIEAKADRTVVRAGDPIALEITVRGQGRLEGLRLPPFTGREGGLPPELFSVPDGPVAGEPIGGRDERATAGASPGTSGGRRFVVSVRVRSTEAREIPPLAFSFFNPIAGRYQTVRSEPIALSVGGSALVGAEQVVAGAAPGGSAAGAGPLPTAAPGTAAAPGATASPTGRGGGPERAAAGSGTPIVTAGAGAAAIALGTDLSLSAPETTLRRARTVRTVAPWLVALHAFPLALGGLVLWRARTTGPRRAAREARGALGRALGAIARAERAASARAAGEAIAAALRELARERGREAAAALAPAIERCERASFDPAAAGRPPDPALATEAREAARRSVGQATKGPRDALAAALALALPAALTAGVHVALARSATGTGGEGPEPPAEVASAVARARAAYRAAMDETVPERRAAAFAEAEALYREAAAAWPGAAELEADWGHAALAAHDLGRATLAYRRALARDPSLGRARRNLAWLRERMPAWAPIPPLLGGALTGALPLSRLAPWERLFLAGATFALAVGLAAAGAVYGRRALRAAAVLPGIVWAALGASAALGDPGGSAAAILVADGAILRAADSTGAPAVLAHPFPAGLEVTALEHRDGWTRVELADGTRGWLPADALASVD